MGCQGRSRRRLALGGVLSLAAVSSCNAILGIEDKPIKDDEVPSLPEAGQPDSPRPATDAADVGAADVGVPGIDCLGATRNAFFCDGFEGLTLSPSWRPTRVPTDGSAQLSQLESATRHTGLKALEARFSPIPSPGVAKLEFQRPERAGSLALQVWFFLDNDAWDATQAVPIFGIVAGTGGGAIAYFVASGTGGGGQVEVRVTGAPTISLGAATPGAWACYELVFDQPTAKVRAFSGATESGIADLSVAIDSAQIGMQWDYGASATAAKSVHFDDVIVSPARIGCAP